MSLSQLAILGALMEKPMHGYELRKYFEHAAGVFWMINYGSIYPALKKLEGDGLVKGITEAAGSVKGKITYSITPTGKKAFQDLLEGRLKKDAFVRDEFTLHLFFMDYLDKKTIKNMLEKKMEGNQVLLDIIKSHEKDIKEEVPKFRYEVLKRGEMHLETEILWLNDTLKEIEKED